MPAPPASMLSEVRQGGEHDQLSRSFPGAQLIGAQQIAQLDPLLVDPAPENGVGEAHQLIELHQLCLDLFGSSSRSGRVG